MLSEIIFSALRPEISGPESGEPNGPSITRTSDGRYRYEVDRKFRDYDTPEEGIRDHAKVLSAKRYAVAWAYRNDITRFAYEIAKAGYCTAEPAAYADLISKIARMIERA